METLIAIASKREERDLRPDPIPDDDLTTILDAGRIAGTAKNEQPCRFVVARGAIKDRLASVVTRPSNVEGAPVVVAITVAAQASKGGFDAGRIMQNMMLAAWALGIGTCPNSVKDPTEAKRLLQVEEGWEIAILVTMGYPKRERRVGDRSFEELVAAADRAPLDEVVRYL